MSRVPTTALAALLLAGCFTLRPAPAPEPALFRVTGEDGRIDALLREVREGSSERRALRAVGRLRLESPQGKGSVREVIVVERPARLRLESLNLLGQTQALLVADGERFAFFDGRTLSAGRLSSDVLRERIGLDFDPAEAVAVLLAAPPIDDGPTRGVLGQGEDRIAELPDQRVRFDASGELRGFDALGPGGAPRFRVEYDRWQEAGAGRYPFWLSVSFPATGTRALLEIREAELNPELEEGVFFVPTGTAE